MLVHGNHLTVGESSLVHSVMQLVFLLHLLQVKMRPLSKLDQCKEYAQEILKIKQTLNERLAFHTGQSIERIEKDTDRDNFMSAEEAKAYGLVDDVLIKR